MIKAVRISQEDTRQRVVSGEALLVCAYDDEEKFRTMHLEGAISFREFINQADSLSKGQEIIFYCA